MGIGNSPITLSTNEGRGSLSELPGCCGVVVSHNAYVYTYLRKKGVGQRMHQQRLDKMRELGYTVGMCTVTDNNAVQIHILKKNGWQKVHTFKNRRTGNIVSIWVNDLWKRSTSSSDMPENTATTVLR